MSDGEEPEAGDTEAAAPQLLGGRLPNGDARGGSLRPGEQPRHWNSRALGIPFIANQVCY